MGKRTGKVAVVTGGSAGIGQGIVAVTGRVMTANANNLVQKAVNAAIREGGEIGLQVAAYVDGELVVDVWGGLADETTGRTVEGDTLFPVFSVTKASCRRPPL